MEGKWICFPGDYEIMLAEKVMARRYQRDFPIGPFWRVDSPWHNVKFYHEFVLTKKCRLKFSYEGRISVFFYQNDFIYDFNGEIELPAGEYKMEVHVYNQSGLPCLKIDSEELITDENFQVGFNFFQLQKCFVIDCGDLTPNTFVLPRRQVDYVSVKDTPKGKLYDLGKIRMCFLSLNSNSQMPVKCYFGETVAETMSDADCEQTEVFTAHGICETKVSKAFRYMRIEADNICDIKIFEEYNSEKEIFNFATEDRKLLEIINTAKYTFSICSREFFLDGAKRDRWLWAGDAYQAFKMEYFVSYNCDKIKRNIIALFGKKPVVTYINHIMDYTLYSILAVSEYYEHSGDRKFVEYIYPMQCAHMEFVLSRTNGDGFLYKQPNDWVFVDWATLDTDGELCFEQILLYLALQSMCKTGRILGNDVSKYESLCISLKQKINLVFWDDKLGVYRHSRKNGVVGDEVTAYANIFSVLYNFVSDDKKARIKNALLFNKDIPEITTPYMQCYKLSCLCELGEYDAAAKETYSYWYSMLDAGATTFWETFKKGETAETATAMYGRPFGRSHCHIWGASALYLIPRYFYGIKNDINCGENFEVKPVIELIKNSEITVPLKRGKLTVKCCDGTVSAFSDELCGELIINDKIYKITRGELLNVNC